MKLLINDKEIADYLFTLLYQDKKIPLDIFADIELNEEHTAQALSWALEKRENRRFIPKKFSAKAVRKIISGVEKDLGNYLKKIRIVIRTYKHDLKKKKLQDLHMIRSNIKYILDKLGTEYVLGNYKKSSQDGFVKSIGLQIDSSAVLVRRDTVVDLKEDCVLRNTVGNGKLLTDLIDNNLPFWFIDSGYTNFVESNKKWHRLVRNHLHVTKYFDAPADRLINFTTFPRPWRKSGENILIIEPGEFSAAIFHVDIDQWRNNIENEIKKFSDKKILIREKIPKKQRQNLYDELLQGDYYCVVTINSNAATEAIWAGIPAITLDQHVTNPVTRSRISDINDLYRGPLGNWLSYLSYCQFTYDELINGTAVDILRRWHA
jgi:hypothetical protein